MNYYKKFSKEVQDEMLAVLKDEERWPQWPYLPMVRSSEQGGPPETAVLRRRLDQKGPYILEMRLLFIPPSDDVKTETYETLEALLEADWYVD